MLATCSLRAHRAQFPPAECASQSRRHSCVQPRATAEPATAASDTKNLETMRKFSEQYAKRTNTYFCSDLSVTAVVIKGLAENKTELGAPLCPCRHYDDKHAEAEQGFWNCPCVPMRERKSLYTDSPASPRKPCCAMCQSPGSNAQECHCMLFLTEDNDFRGDEQTLPLDQLVEMTKDM